MHYELCIEKGSTPSGMTTAEQTVDNLMLLHSKSHADKKHFSTMSDVCEALIVFLV